LGPSQELVLVASLLEATSPLFKLCVLARAERSGSVGQKIFPERMRRALSVRLIHGEPQLWH